MKPIVLVMDEHLRRSAGGGEIRESMDLPGGTSVERRAALKVVPWKERAHAPQETARGEHDGMLAVDASTRRVLALARQAAACDITVLIMGESGTGKEVLARFIHTHSQRSLGPFVAINCAAIPQNMLEAVLFGHEKGAFTGAHKTYAGKFEQAQGGTLLLDEISELDLDLQAKLLRVLQEREVERLGGRGLIPLDLRVLATSNRDLKAQVGRGRFREDLFYRLNVFPLRLPPLRERRDDILPLAEYLLARAGRGQARPVPRLAKAAALRLLSYPWPGNVRELDNVLQRALVLQPGEAIETSDLHLEPLEIPPGNSLQDSLPVQPEPRATNALTHDLRTREYQLIADAIEASGGSRKTAAERLGISPRTLRYKLARMRAEGLAVPQRVP
jgi:two-component system response regulator FlrC